MGTKGKVQTNDYKVNVLVETVTSSNQHYSHLNKEVSVTKVLSDEEIIDLWKNRKVKGDDELELAKKWLMKEKGYAISNIKDDTLNIDFDSVVAYKER